MRQSRLFQSLALGVLLALVPLASAANAQTVSSATCVGGPRALTKQESSMVNDFEILVARANSQHTPVPAVSPDIAALLACSAAGGPAAPAPTTPAAPASSSSSTSVAAGTCVGGPRALTKQEGSMVNDFEILVARANSQHTPVPAVSPDIAALIACSAAGGPAASTPAASTSASSSSSTSAAAGTCVGGPRALTKQEGSMVNDYEILAAKAASQHTPVPTLSPDIAALIACS